MAKYVRGMCLPPGLSLKCTYTSAQISHVYLYG